MVLLVKLLRPALGFGSEAIHKVRGKSSVPPSNTNPTTNSTSEEANSPPDYYEVNDEAIARQLVQDGQAEFVDPSHHNAEWKRQANQYAHEAHHIGQDEALWQLDEMAEHMRPEHDTSTEPNRSDTEDVKINKREAMVRELLETAGPAPPPEQLQRLPSAVILPQRRPGNKGRGFVRAFAPALECCGITQDVWMDFLDKLDAANTASKWIEVVHIAGIAVGCVPNTAAMVTGMIIEVIAGTAKELQSRSRENTFLDRVNQELLAPRGLYCMLMAFKDDIQDPTPTMLGAASSLFKKEKLDIDQTVEKYSNPDPNKSKFKKNMSRMRLVSGKTTGNLELPEAAPLIYPDLDKVIEQAVEGQDSSPRIKAKLQGAGTWVQDYLDRRAHASLVSRRARWRHSILLCLYQALTLIQEARNPGTAVALPADQRDPLKSRFNDPNHPANSGSLVALLTGGAIPMPGVNEMVKSTQKQINKQFGKDGEKSVVGSTGLPSAGLINKLAHKDTLYLLVVNLPTKEEVQHSAAELERVVAEGQVLPVSGSHFAERM